MKQLTKPIRYLAVTFFVLASINLVSVHAQQLDKGIIVSPLKYTYDVEPGTVIEDVLKVYNATPSDETVYFFAKNFKADNETGIPILFDEVLPLAASLKDWVNFSVDSLLVKKVVEDNTNIAQIKFKITVPKDAEPGGHYAVILASLDNPDKPIAQKSGNVSFRLNSGALILLNVKGDVSRELNIEQFFTVNPFSAKKEAQSLFEWFPVGLSTRLVNTGNSHVMPVGNIIIYQGDNQVESIPFNPDINAILGNSSRNFYFQTANTFISLVPEEVDQDGKKIPVTDEQGNIKTNLKIDIDLIRSFFRFGKFKAELLAGYEDNGNKRNLIATAEFWVIPWKIILIIFLLIVIIFVIKRKRKQNVIKSKKVSFRK